MQKFLVSGLPFKIFPESFTSKKVKIWESNMNFPEVLTKTFTVKTKLFISKKIINVAFKLLSWNVSHWQFAGKLGEFDIRFAKDFRSPRPRPLCSAYAILTFIMEHGTDILSWKTTIVNLILGLPKILFKEKSFLELLKQILLCSLHVH